MQLSERARDLRHRVAEIVGGLTGPQEYELDGAILAALEELRAAAEAAAYARAAQAVEAELNSGYVRSGILRRFSRVLNFPRDQQLAHIDAVKFHLVAAIRALK